MRFDLLFFIVCYVGTIWCICGFCEMYMENFKISKRFVIPALLITELMVNIFNERLDMPYIISAAASHLIFTGVVLIVFREAYQRKIFVASVLIVTRTLVWNFFCSLLSCVVLATVKFVAGGKITSLSLSMDNWIGGAAYIAVITAVSMLRKKFDEVLRNKIKNWYLILSVPLFFIVAIFDVVNWGASNGIMVMSNASGAADGNIYYNQIFSHIGICLLSALSMCIAFGLVFGGNKVYVEQRQKEQYRSQIEFYKMLNEQYIQMERLRHDMKNHVISLYGLWNSREYEKAGNYLKKMLDNGNIGTCDEVTGNKAVDALLYHKSSEARQRNIYWECDVHFPQNCTVDEFDMCILFGNILDNALNACSEVEDESYRFIRIRSQSVKKCLLIVVTNGTIMKDIKEIKQSTGLFNIKDTVDKYNGVVSMKVENGVFENSILIPMNRDGHDREQAV